MKGMIPSADYMRRFRKNIIGFGYNYLLVELEDKFPYRNYGFMVHPDAYGKEELAALHSDRLKVIPLLQCVGHLDYLLKHPQMKHLRHRDSIYMWDMSNPEVFKVWCEMADEILEVYPDCEYFHIGADEAELKTEEDFEIYLRHVERCADYLISRGKKVIMWHDMFVKHDLEKIRPLLKKVIVQMWFYYTVRHEQIEALLSAGATVWGASRIQDDGIYKGMTSQPKMRRNADDWTIANAKYHLDGHTGTVWGRTQSTYPLSGTLPQSAYMIAYLGESLETGKIPDQEKFHHRLAEWFGDPELDVGGIAENFYYDPEAAAKLLHPVPEHNDIMEIWTVLNEMDCLFAYMDRCFESNFAMHGLYRSGDAPPRTTQNYLDGCRIIRKKTGMLRQRIDSVLGRYFPPELLKEFIHERFDGLLDLNDLQERELRNAVQSYREKQENVPAPGGEENSDRTVPDQEGAIAAFQQVAAYTESLWKNDYNTDESKVREYTLPEIRSKTVEEWESQERPELLRRFKEMMYGEMPGRPDEMRFELLSQKDDALDGLAVRKEIRLYFSMKNGRKFDFDMLLYIPKSACGPVPVFVGLNFWGNQANTPETDVRITRQTLQEFGSDMYLKPLHRERGVKLDSWNYVEAMKRGYAVATACYGEICPDHLNGLKNSVFTLFYDENELRSEYEIPFQEQKGGRTRRKICVIGAWSWGLSRMLDALEREPLVDAAKAMVIGHSRNAKAALWAGMCDPRFAIVFSNDSGCGGASLSRRNFGETLRILYWEKRSWFSGNLVDYIDDPDRLPVDQHQLLALAAPRRVYVASATQDANADPKGEFLAACAASKVWTLYGKTGLGTDAMPPPDCPVGDHVGYHIRSGKHAITGWDWAQYYNFADRVFGRTR